MFGSILSLTSSVARVAITPVTVAADVVTIGGLMTDRDEPYTATNLKNALEDLDDAIEK